MVTGQPILEESHPNSCLLPIFKCDYLDDQKRLSTFGRLFEKLKRFPIVDKSFFFDSNAEFRPRNKSKNFALLKNFITLYDVIMTSQNEILRVCFFQNLKFNQISIEWWV